jgi:GNAT superfamily N-acetyltransferase
MTRMLFSDLDLSKRLERAEGYACLQWAQARRLVLPTCGSTWIEHAGAFAVFDGVESPVTQTFGLGLFEPLSAEALETIERFFFSRGAPAQHEISPLVGVPAIELLCDRGYKPMEVSSVMVQAVDRVSAAPPPNTNVRVIEANESALWSDVSARGWSHEHPELRQFLQDLGRIAAARADGVCFLAECDGTPGAAGSLCLYQGVALFGGSATVPELRRRGLQAALLQARMHYAHEHGCDLAMMVAAPGSDSQRNAERAGFRIAYTRTKWRLQPQA